MQNPACPVACVCTLEHMSGYQLGGWEDIIGYQNVGKDLDNKGAGFSACCSRTIGEEPFGFYTKTWTKGECRVIAPPHSAITFDVFVRIKQEFCRFFGLSMISSTHISGTYFYQDLMLSYQSFPTLFFFPISLSSPFSIGFHFPLTFSP